MWWDYKPTFRTKPYLHGSWTNGCLKKKANTSCTLLTKGEVTPCLIFFNWYSSFCYLHTSERFQVQFQTTTIKTNETIKGVRETFGFPVNIKYSILYSVKRREAKSKGEKERYIHLDAEFQRRARRKKNAFFNDQCKEIEEWERLEISSRKLEIPREHFMQRWAW